MPFRICTVRADAVELYAMPLKPTQAQAIGNLHLGPVPDDRRVWVWVSLQLDWEIDDVIRIWTGSGAESSMWEEAVHPASGFAELHAERIEGVLRRGWPDPWLHSLSGTLAANLRCCAVVYSTTLHEKVSVTRPRVDQYPLVSKEYYRIFSERPDLVELVLAFPGLLVVPDALRMGKLDDTARSAAPVPLRPYDAAGVADRRRVARSGGRDHGCARGLHRACPDLELALRRARRPPACGRRRHRRTPFGALGVETHRPGARACACACARSCRYEALARGSRSHFPQSHPARLWARLGGGCVREGTKSYDKR